MCPLEHESLHGIHVTPDVYIKDTRCSRSLIALFATPRRSTHRTSLAVEMPSVSMAVSESRPLLSASPRQSMEDISTEWTSTSESTVSFNTGFSRVTFGSHDQNISVPSIRAKGDYGSPQPISHIKSQSSGFIDSPTSDSNGLPSGVAFCGTSRSNEQDRRVWISGVF